MKILLSGLLTVLLLFSVFDHINGSSKSLNRATPKNAPTYRAPVYRAPVYRAPTYRAPNYRATTYRASYRYKVKIEVKQRYGGVPRLNKHSIYVRGGVYIWPGQHANIRSNNLDDYAMCEGTPSDLNGTLNTQYTYFICPPSKFSDERFCCEQECCTYENFGYRYGELECDNINGTLFDCETRSGAKSNAGSIVGGIFVALVVIGLIIVVIAWRRRRHLPGTIVQQTTTTSVIQTEYKSVPTAEQSIYPVGQAPGPQYPVGQAPGPQYPVGQAPGPQYPVGQAPGPQYPLGSVPAPYPPNAAMPYPPS